MRMPQNCITKSHFIVYFSLPSPNVTPFFYFSRPVGILAVRDHVKNRIGEPSPVYSHWTVTYFGDDGESHGSYPSIRSYAHPGEPLQITEIGVHFRFFCFGRSWNRYERQ